MNTHMTQINKKLIEALLEKPTEQIDHNETKMLDEYLTEMSSHDCSNDPSDRHCPICFQGAKIACKLGQIEKRDEQIERDVESVLLEKAGQEAVM